VLVWGPNDRYEGEWKNFTKHGKGVDRFPNGDMYDGDFKDGLPDGKGVYIWDNKAIYTGDFWAGMKHGSGHWRENKEDPESTYYEGEYKYDRRCGKGKFFWKNGDRYQGDFADDDQHGFGTMVWKTNGITYEGYWEHGIQMGWGKVTYQNGEVKEGFFMSEKIMTKAQFEQLRSNDSFNIENANKIQELVQKHKLDNKNTLTATRKGPNLTSASKKDYNTGLKSGSVSIANFPNTSVKKDKKHQTFHNSSGSKLKFGALSSGLNDNASPEGRPLPMNRRNSATSRKSKSQLSNISEQADKMSMKSN